jgi:DNA-binding NarL/FixJ family response regulator
VAIRVLVVDNQVLVRRGTTALLRHAPDLEVVGQAGSGREAVEVSCREHPHVVIIEPQLPDGDGLDTIRAIRRECPEANVLVLAQREDPDQAVRAFEAGAVGYILKDIEPEHLLTAVRHVASGKAMLNPRVARHILDRLATGGGRTANGGLLRAKGVTNRELDVLTLVANGMSDREIAGRLYLSEATIKTHLKSVYRKLAARNRAQAAAIAALVGLVHRTPA